jgi:hypothetical protein
MRCTVQPGSVGLPEKPYPGSDGQTTWNASAGSSGSVSGPMTDSNSMIEPGQPWVRTSGRAPSCGERTCRKWTSSPPIAVVNCGSAFSRASVRRQS